MILAKKHILFIDGLRAMAAIFVVMHHAALQYYDLSTSTLKDFSSYHLSTVQKITLMPFFQGHYAVDIFIVLSGFSLMLSVINNGYVSKGGSLLFLKRRVIRILPPYYAAMGLSLILIWLFVGTKTGTHWDVSLPVTFTNVFTHVLLIHDFFGSSFSRVNHCLWSIAVEFRIYFFFPLLLWFWRKLGAPMAVLLSVSISIAGLFLLSVLKSIYSDIDIEYPGVSPYILLFVFGMLAADVAYAYHSRYINFRNTFKNLNILAKIALPLAFLLAIVLVKHGFKSASPEYLHLPEKIIDLLVGVFSAYLLFVLSVSEPVDHSYIFLKILSWKPLTIIGTFSYSLYLIHPPLLQIITQYILPYAHLNRFYSCICLITIGTVSLIPLAYLFFLGFERPFLNQKNSTVLKTHEEQMSENTVRQLV